MTPRGAMQAGLELRGSAAACRLYGRPRPAGVRLQMGPGGALSPCSISFCCCAGVLSSVSAHSRPWCRPSLTTAALDGTPNSASLAPAARPPGLPRCGPALPMQARQLIQRLEVECSAGAGVPAQAARVRALHAVGSCRQLSRLQPAASRGSTPRTAHAVFFGSSEMARALASPADFPALEMLVTAVHCASNLAAGRGRSTPCRACAPSRVPGPSARRHCCEPIRVVRGRLARAQRAGNYATARPALPAARW